MKITRVDVSGTEYMLDFTGTNIYLVEKEEGGKRRRRVRRSHFEGLYVQLSRSQHLTSIQARINEVQVCVCVCVCVCVWCVCVCVCGVCVCVCVCVQDHISTV